MLRRLTLGLFVLACASAVAACSSSNTNPPSSGGEPGIGPNFVTNTLYVSNTTQNDILIYTPSPGPSATPQYSIGGGNTSMNGPEYIAFDSGKRLFTTNYNAGTKAGGITVYAQWATGNVLPVTTLPFAAGVQPRGIAIFPAAASEYAVSFTAPGQFFTSSVQVFATSTNAVLHNIAGSNTGLNSPTGIAVDANSNIYVANSGNASVTIYTLPSPTPTPSPTTTPSPTPTPSVSPSSSPTPTPTPASENLTPSTTIAGANTQLVTPVGASLDSSGNLYVTDVGASGQAPKVLIFNAPPLGGGLQNLAPSAVITSSAFVYPTDVKVDAAGNIYVADAGAGPASGGSSTSKVFIFAPHSNGASTPAVTLTVPLGSVMGLALSP